MDKDDLTPTEPLDRALLRASCPENDDEVTKRECPRCGGRGAKLDERTGTFERGDCTLCKGACMVTVADARAWELHREMNEIITGGPR